MFLSVSISPALTLMVTTAETQSNASSALTPEAQSRTTRALKPPIPQAIQGACEHPTPRPIVAELSAAAANGHPTALARHFDHDTSNLTVSHTVGSQAPAHGSCNTVTTQPTHPRQFVPATNKPLTAQTSTASHESKREQPSITSGNSAVTGLQRGPYDFANSTLPASSVRPLHMPNTVFVRRPPPSPASRAVARNETTASIAALAAGVSPPTPLGTPPLRMQKRAKSPAVTVDGPSAPSAMHTVTVPLRAQPSKASTLAD
ncbi:hypothetical protein QFC21_003195 [Naganishia friedmannii]|uniref:Uncharacterized protein n=1 Tax=Naganishia friedmannii TaxID=89922 RepID=A0ACC2VS05_9TREE|nr:hypothetical protein QFC21_003195 [Naganishia friedmannii]